MTRRRWWLLGAVPLMVWAGFAAFLLLRSARDLQAGKDAATAARGQTDLASLTSGGPAYELRTANRRFERASSTTGGVVLAPVRILPVVGRQIRSAHALATAAATVADAGAEALETLAEVVDRPPAAGPSRVRQVQDLAVAVEKARARVVGVRSLGPDEALLGPLADARAELEDEVAEARRTLTDAAAGTRAVAELLAGPRRYLLIAANNAEMRAGSGMWLSGGVLTVAAGRLDLGPVQPLYEVGDPPDGAVPVGDADLEARWGFTHPSWDYRDLMTSPRFQPAAELAARMWAASGQDPVDGVLVVDPVAVAAVVKATGPVEAGGRTITGDQVVHELLSRQYAGLAGIAPEAQHGRRDLLSEVARSAFTALDGGGWSLSQLSTELAAAARGRHLLVWSADEQANRAWRTAGLGGELVGDSVLVSLLNRAANKIDWHTRTEAELDTRPTGDDTEVVVRVRVRNETPADAPRYVSGPPPALDYAPGTYRGILTVNVPGAALGLAVDGQSTAVVFGADGPTQVIGIVMEVPRGESIERTIRFRLPGRRGRLVVEPSARVPATIWKVSGTTMEDSVRFTTKW